MHWRHSLFYYPLTWTLWYSTYIDIVPSAWGTCMLSFENEISFCTGWTFWKHNSCLLSSCGFLLLHFFCTFSNFEKEVKYPVYHVSYFIKFRECSKRMLNSENINFFIYYFLFCKAINSNLNSVHLCYDNNIIVLNFKNITALFCKEFKRIS